MGVARSGGDFLFQSGVFRCMELRTAYQTGDRAADTPYTQVKGRYETRTTRRRTHDCPDLGPHVGDWGDGKLGSLGETCLACLGRSVWLSQDRRCTECQASQARQGDVPLTE